MSASLAYRPHRKNTETSRINRHTFWQCIWELARFRPWLYVGMSVMLIFVYAVLPQITGLLTREFYDSVTGDAKLGIGSLSLSGLIFGVALARSTVIFANRLAHAVSRFAIGALLRKNMLQQILDQPRAQVPPISPSEAVSHFRGDVDELARFVLQVPFEISHLLFAITAMVIMLRIEARVTLIVFLPMIALAVVATAGRKRVRLYREANRAATGKVTDFVGEMFGAAQAIKVASAEERVIDHLRDLNLARRRAAVRDHVFSALLQSVIENVISVGTGAILLLAGQGMRQGTFTVGDFALFVYYLGWVTEFVSVFGTFWRQFKQSEVSFARIGHLLQGAPAETLVQHSTLYLRSIPPALMHLPKMDEHRLEQLDVAGLTYTYPDTGRGVAGIDLHLERGSFTVITGRVGSGKTTLLRTLLGLLPKDAGEVRWNGRIVSDATTFLVPPRIAYTAQVPTLFSESLRDNILMGLPEARVDLARALHVAVMEQDLAEWPDQLDTIIGIKGVRLSGGQRQRTAAARMLVRDPELLIIDDLSSALDVETERTLWTRLLDGRASRHSPTYLVVSHRRTTLSRADQIVLLVDGRVEATGTLKDLLASNQEMQRLWDAVQVGREEGFTPVAK